MEVAEIEIARIIKNEKHREISSFLDRRRVERKRERIDRVKVP